MKLTSRTRQLATALALASTSTAHAGGQAPAGLDSFPVPAFDLTTLEASAGSVLQALQTDGIMALRNVPGYAAARSEYLAAATACAVASSKSSNDFLLYKSLNDGTQRYTISTTSGKQLPMAAAEVEPHCPGYVAKYQAFSGLIESAVAKLGQALDAAPLQYSGANGQGGAALTSTKLLTESVHLDHFHAYEAAPTPTSEEAALLSLDMHTDNGILIAMSAPKYFDVHAGNDVQEKTLGTYESGLLIETRAGKLVRPVLKEDELVLMVGSGFQEWVRTTPALRPVPHGMKYPNAEIVGERLIRAWVGKMILLQPEQRMLNMDMTFGEYAAQTTRYLLEGGEHDHEHDSSFAALACPHGRRLHDNDKKCVVKQCFPKSGKDPEIPCSIQCNLSPMSRPGADRLCEENCECKDKPGNASATYCWMLCVEMLPAGQCDAQGQRCKTGVEAPYIVDQAYICSSNASNDSIKASAPSVPSPTKKSEATVLQWALTGSTVAGLLVQLVLA